MYISAWQGYSTCRATDLVGLGVSAIGKVGNSFVQNQKDIRDWQALIAEGKLPVWRGIGLSSEDRLRREVISAIMCQGQLKFGEIEQEFGIDFTDHFALELDSLRPLVDDGLIELSGEELEVTPVGLLLLRVIAMKFDEYLIKDHSAKAYSKVI